MKKSEKVISAFNFAYSLYEKYKSSDLYEQLALIEAIQKFNLAILQLDRTIFNTTPVDRHKDTLVMHIMGPIKRYLDKNRWYELFCK